MRPFVQSLVMGLFCTVIGVGMGFKVWSDAIGKGYEVMPVLAGTASLLVGTYLWWLLVARKSNG